MQEILKSKIFTQYNFSKIDHDYTLDGLVDEKLDYFNLEKICLQILFYRKYDNNIIPDRINKFIIFDFQ